VLSFSYSSLYDNVSQYLSNYLTCEDDCFTIHFGIFCPLSLCITSGVIMSTLCAVKSDTLEEDLLHSLAEFSLPECIHLDTTVKKWKPHHIPGHMPVWLIMALAVKVAFRDTMPCNQVHRHWHFGGTCSFHLHGELFNPEDSGTIFLWNVGVEPWRC
jgi:hypothetical protein